MRRSLAILLCFFGLASNAQYLHTPEEMVRIMEQSQLKYLIDTLTQTKSNNKFPLIDKGWWAIPTAEGIELQRRIGTTNNKATGLYEKGLKLYHDAKYYKAIDFCEKAHNNAPSDTEILKRIGRSYGAIGKIEVAGTWYRKALDLNPIDFEAHFLLADVYMQNRTKDKAIYHITMAHVLNRNHKDIFEQFKKIYTAFNVTYNDWKFEPSYHLTKVDNKINVAAQKAPWKSYANCKAVWQYESGYRDKMKNLSTAPSERTEEKECLLNALISYEKMESDKTAYPELATLSLAVPQRMVDYYILYEIESKREPLMVSQLPQEQLDKLVEYVSSFRAKQR